MTDLISRQAAIKYLMDNMNWYDEDGYETDEDYKRECITELINGVPSAEPVRHGKWIYIYKKVPVFNYQCSECGARSILFENFCSYCGARMDKE